MTTLAPWTEQWQHFQTELREQFWGDLAQQTRQSWQDFLGRLSLEARDRHLGVREYERSAARTDARNGFYERDFVTRLGTLRVRVARTRQQAFLPPGLARLERRAPEVLLWIREAFLRGLSTRAVGRVVALLTEEAVSAQTVSRLTRDLDRAVAQFHQAPLTDDWRYLFLDGVSLRGRRPGGRKRMQLLVAYGVRADGTRQLLAFTRSTGESQAAWEGLLHEVYRRGLEGRQLQLIVTDGCAGLAAALQTVYPRVSRVIQMSPVRVIENSPPALGCRCRFLQSHEPRFKLLLEPIGMAPDINGDRMVQHAIKDRGRQDPVPKHLPPGTEALITCENHRSLLVAA